MKKLLLTLSFLFISLFTYSQVIENYCTDDYVYGYEYTQRIYRFHVYEYRNYSVYYKYTPVLTIRFNNGIKFRWYNYHYPQYYHSYNYYRYKPIYSYYKPYRIYKPSYTRTYNSNYNRTYYNNTNTYRKVESNKTYNRYNSNRSYNSSYNRGNNSSYNRGNNSRSYNSYRNSSRSYSGRR